MSVYVFSPVINQSVGRLFENRIHDTQFHKMQVGARFIAPNVIKIASNDINNTVPNKGIIDCNSINQGDINRNMQTRAR